MTKEVHLWFVPTPHIRGDAQANVPRSWAPANRSNMLFQWWVSLPPCITLIPIAHKLCLCYCFLPSQTYTQETFRPDLFYHPLGKHCRSFEIGISAPESNCLPSWKMSIFYTLTSAFMEMKSASHSVTFFNFTAYNCSLPVCETLSRFSLINYREVIGLIHDWNFLLSLFANHQPFVMIS